MATPENIKEKDLSFSIEDPLKGAWVVGNLEDLIGNGKHIGTVWSFPSDSPNNFQKHTIDWGDEVNRVRGHVNAVRNGMFFFTSYGGWTEGIPIVSMDLKKKTADELIFELDRV